MDDAEFSSLLQAGYSHTDAFRMHEGDSRNLKKCLSRYFSERGIESSPVDVTITSPPYADLKNYQGNEETQIGFGDSYQEYLNQLRKVFQQVYDITANSGTMWVIINTFRRDGRVTRLPSDIADICENLEAQTDCERCGAPVRQQRDTGRLVCQNDACGYTYDALEYSWRLQDMLVWNKQRARPYTKSKSFRNVFEYILCFSKSQDPEFDIDSVRIADTRQFKRWWVDWPQRYHPRGMIPENIWEMVTPSQGSWGSRDYNHPAPFPPALVERIVRLTTKSGDIVLDPFAGTGTVPIQANIMDRYGIGFDTSSEYVSSYEDVRAALEERWSTRQERGETLEQQQQRLAKLMWRLRQLVYAKHLFKELRQQLTAVESPNSQVHSIFVRSPNLNFVDIDPSVSTVTTEVDVVFQNQVDEDVVSETTQLMTNFQDRKPWVGFNIDATTRAWESDEFKSAIADKYWGDSTHLFVYPSGQHHSYERLITQQQWVDSTKSPDAWRDKYASESYHPLISNIGIRIDRNGETPIIEHESTEGPFSSNIPDYSNREYTKFETTSTTLQDFEG